MSDPPCHGGTRHTGLGATLPQHELCLTNYFSIAYFHPEALGLGLPVSSWGTGGGEGGASQPVTPSLPVPLLGSTFSRVLPAFSHLQVFLIYDFFFFTVYSH